MNATMNATMNTLLSCFAISLLAACSGPGVQSPAPAAERVRKYIIDSETSAWNLPSDKSIRDKAARAMKRRVRPVTEKRFLPKSGNPHDYFSMGPYWWPNPNTTNGLPYVRRDGQFNRERNDDSDRDRIRHLEEDVSALTAAALRLGDHAAGREAARRLRVFFLDPATRVNPHLEYAQAIPGVTDGRGVGIIDTLGLACGTVDAILILHGTGDLPNADFEGLRRWFGDYLDWLCSSKNGRDERAAKNNHGSNIDLQCAIYALFTGRKDLAREILLGVPKRRIDVQIEPDGRQPLELRRTRSHSYSCFNLDMLLHLALLGETLGVDIWGYESADGRSIRKAAAFMTPHWTGERKWPCQQITPEPIAPGRETVSLLRHFGVAVPTP